MRKIAEMSRVAGKQNLVKAVAMVHLHRIAFGSGFVSPPSAVPQAGCLNSLPQDR